MATGICPFCGKTVDKFIMFHGDIVGCRYCGIHTKQTNADIIRAMSDEELAEFCFRITDDVASYYGGDGYEPKYPVASKGWLDWLKQNAKDDECDCKEIFENTTDCPCDNCEKMKE